MYFFFINFFLQTHHTTLLVVLLIKNSFVETQTFSRRKKTFITMDGEDEMKADVASLLEVNSLDYRLPPSLSVAVSRAMKTYRSANITHSFGEMISITLSTGAAFIDPLNSYISFDVKIPDAAIVSNAIALPTHGSWAQMFDRFTVVHSSATELDRMTASLGEYCQFKDYYERDANWRKTTGALFNHGDDNGAAGRIGATSNSYPTWPVGPAGDQSIACILPTSDQPFPASYTPGDVINVRIPLAQILPIFKSNLLMPSFLAAGMRIELTSHTKERFFTLKNPSNAGGAQWSVAANQQPSISNVFIHTESFQLGDSINRKLAQISASSGLEWNFTAVHQTFTGKTEASFSHQISRALSRANNIIMKVRRDVDFKSPYADSFSSLPFPSQSILNSAANQGVRALPVFQLLDGTIERFQVQLGAQYIPAEALDNVYDIFHSTLKTFGGLRRSDTSIGLTWDQFAGKLITYDKTGGAEDIDYATSIGCIAVPLESSSTLGESGSAISAQRTAVINVETKNSAGALRRFDFFVEYSKLNTVFLDSVIVRT